MTISTDKQLLDIPMIYDYLHNEAYWAKGRPRHIVERSIEHSLCFGLYVDDRQVGFARVVTDYAIFAWLMDVFILPGHQGKGYGKALVNRILNEPELATVKTWGLKTQDAHALYQQFDFQHLDKPEMFLERKVGG